MKRILLGLAAVGVASFGAMSCATDPTGELSGTPTSISTSLSSIFMNVGDSIQVSARTLDGQGVAHPSAPEVSSQTASVVTVSEIESGPLSQTLFFIKAVAFGQGTVAVSRGGASRSIAIQTFPAKVAITGSVDTVGSGSTVQLGPDPQDVGGASITADTIYTWASDDPTVLSVDSTGLVSAAAPGQAEITVTAPGEGDAGGATASVTMTVAPGAFGGSLSTATGVGGDLVTVNAAAGGPNFDSDTQLSLGGETAWLESQTASVIEFAVPVTGAAGDQVLTFTNMGPTQIAQVVTFTNTDAAGDRYSPGNYSETGAPDLASILSAGGYAYFAHTGGRGIFNGGSEVDHYFAVTAGAADLDIDVLLEWQNGSDVDIYVCDNALASCPFTFFSGSDSDEDASGITIPAGETWFVIASMWEAGSALTQFRISVTGLP